MTEEMRFTQFVFNDMIKSMVGADEATIRETVIDLMNRSAEAAGTKSIMLLWAVLRAAGGSVEVSAEIERTCDPTKCFINKEATGEGTRYNAGIKE